jgi:hypothetical protein
MKGNAFKPNERVRMADFTVLAVADGWSKPGLSQAPEEPITMGIDPEDGAVVLIDGFHRAVQFIDGPDQGVRIPVYVPVSSNGPHVIDSAT